VKRVGTLWRRTRAFARLSGLAAWHGFIEYTRGDSLTYAASIAYYALLSLFPLFMLGLALLGHVTADVGRRNALLDFVLRYFPTQFDFVTDQLDALRASHFPLGVVGTIALVWGGLGVFNAISTAVNYAWGVQEQRSFIKHRLFAFLMLVVAGLLLMLAVLLISATQLVRSSPYALVLVQFPGLRSLGSLTVRNATTLLFVVVVGFIFYFVPNAKVRFRDVWVGAVLTGLLWKAVLVGFSWYMTDMTRFARVNGSVAAVVLFLIWVYAQAVILLYGVQFTAAFARLRRGRSEALPAAPAPRA
jgi:membrane protein